MGTFKFSMRMLVKDYKKSIFYGITLVFAVAVCFVFFNIINNADLADQTIARRCTNAIFISVIIFDYLFLLFYGFLCK